MGGVLLQQHVAQAHQLHPAPLVGVVGEHPHIGVVPGDELLEDHPARIARGVHLIQGGKQLLPRLADIHLFQLAVAGGPVGHAVGGLGHIGRPPGQLKVVAHVPRIDKGGRVVDAILVAQGIELLLVGELVQQPAADIITLHVGRKAVLQVGGQLHIAVPAADDQHRLARAFPGHVFHVLQEYVRVLVLQAGPVVDDGAVGAGEGGGKLAEGDAFHPVGLVEGPGHAVYIDIAAEQKRLERNIRHLKSGSFEMINRETACRLGAGRGPHPPARRTRNTPGIWDSLLITPFSSRWSWT